MASQTLTQTQQSTPALPGAWKLGAGRAVTLQPREAGALRVAHGCLWATFDGPHGGALNESGDHVLGAGERLVLQAGQRLVVEAWNGAAPAYFSWDPVAAPLASPSRRLAAVVQPLADLRLALALGAGAVGRLVAGLAGLALDLVTGRARESLADCAFNAQSKACRAHGAMS
jgi:hypothetical protein